jgi:hypothetical protein
MPSTPPMVTKRTALTNVAVSGVVGCALGILASLALTPTSFSRVPAWPRWGVTSFARGPDYALRLTQEGATFLIASRQDPTNLIELKAELPELEAGPAERRPAVLTCEQPPGHESLEPDAERAELRSIQFRLDSGE